MTDILVVGGAGYIGSYMCKCLSKNGYNPIVLDNLVYGHREAVRWGPLYTACMSDGEHLDSIFSSHRIEAVMHFAAFCYVGESMDEPLKYYNNNVSNTVKLFETMLKNKVNKFIFSSSCATYGEPEEIPITEMHVQRPVNPYGRTKLMVEQILDDLKTACDMRSISLRYFNAAGADPECEIGECHEPETHLIPLILQVPLGKRNDIKIFGDDYPTRDGTCVRDYIHIADLAKAHLLALEKLLNGGSGDQYNLGTGQGYTVKEVIERAIQLTGRSIPVNVIRKRAGDPAILISSSEKAVTDLGWKPLSSDLDTIIETAWNWHRNNPNGY